MNSTNASTPTTVASPTPPHSSGPRLVLAALSGLLLAAPVAAFEIESYVIAPGGGAANQGGWDLHATLGQPLAGSSEGGTFELRAGFWSAEFIQEPPVDAIFSDRFMNPVPTINEETSDAQSHHSRPDSAGRADPSASGEG